MIILRLILVLAAGYLVLGLWFGMSFGVSVLLSKMKINHTGNFPGFLVSIIPTAIILISSQNLYFRISGVLSWKAWFLMIIAAISASAIVAIGSEKPQRVAGGLAATYIDGIIVEVPMRWMMQTFLMYFSINMQIPCAAYWAIFANAVVWCMGIITQNLIVAGGKKEIGREITASFVFSVFIGYAYVESELILIPMIGHFLERMLASWFKAGGRGSLSDTRE